MYVDCPIGATPPERHLSRKTFTLSKTTNISQRFDFTQSGHGPALIFLHGWPFDTRSFRKLIPELARHNTCYNLNSVGIAHGGRGCEDTNMDFPDHAERVIAFANELGLDRFSLLAHDTGATIARLVAADAPERVDKLVLLNTEIPFHRPPFIPQYQKLFALPGSAGITKRLLKTKAYRQSARGYGGSFFDKNLIEGEFKSLFVDDFLADKQKFRGRIRYLTQLDFERIDRLDEVHTKIIAPTLFIWGQQDTTFPADLGKTMADKMPSCVGFVEVENCCFLPQEEQPEVVLHHTLNFLNAGSGSAG